MGRTIWTGENCALMGCVDNYRGTCLIVQTRKSGLWRSADRNPAWSVGSPYFKFRILTETVFLFVPFPNSESDPAMGLSESLCGELFANGPALVKLIGA